MNAFLIALLFAVGASVWFYTKLQRRMGNSNSTQALKSALIAGVIAFVVFLTIFLTLFPQ